jgi:hypothetical protein
MTYLPSSRPPKPPRSAAAQLGLNQAAAEAHVYAGGHLWINSAGWGDLSRVYAVSRGPCRPVFWHTRRHVTKLVDSCPSSYGGVTPPGPMDSDSAALIICLPAWQLTFMWKHPIPLVWRRTTVALQRTKGRTP